jgi:4'-phosphopantetheinyl transferase
VHVWRVSLAPPFVPDCEVERTLDGEERRVASRFRYGDDRRRYTISHIALRDVLARYLGVSAGRIEFANGPHGKPRLAGELAERDLRFNLSYCRHLALVAVGWNREVGVDVEAIAPDAGDVELAARRFAPREVAVLQALPPAERHTAFFRFWTRKEAYLKAVGQGLSIALDLVDTTPDIVDPADCAIAHRSSRWSLHSFDPGHNCAAALAIQGVTAHLRRFDWR